MMLLFYMFMEVSSCSLPAAVTQPTYVVAN